MQLGYRNMVISKFILFKKGANILPKHRFKKKKNMVGIYMYMFNYKKQFSK